MQTISQSAPKGGSVSVQQVEQVIAQACPAESYRGKRVLLVLDNASWHKTKSLHWHHIEPVYLPPYSPDFNPIERLWQHLKGNYLAGYFTKQSKDLSDKLVESIQDLMERPKIIRSVCRTHSE